MKRISKIVIFVLILLAFPMAIKAAGLEETIEKSILFFVEIIGGLAIFLYGINTIDDGLKNLAGSKIRVIISIVTKNKWLSIFVGIAITFMLQSGSAAVYMITGFTNAALINLNQAIGLILGAGIGNTLFVQIFAFNILKYSAFILTIGFFILFLSKQKKFIYLGRIIFGIGLAFFGMKVISQNTASVAYFSQYEEILHLFINKPLYGLIISAVMTTLLHSSTAIIGIFLAISFHNPSPYLFRAAIPAVIGANIGSTLVVFMYGIQQYKAESRRVAVANLLIKLIGALLFIPLMDYWEIIILYTASDAAHSIANFHTLFNISMAIIILPFISVMEKFLNHIIPGETEIYSDEHPRFLNDSVLETPDIALGQAFRETMRMSGFVQEMLQDTYTVLETDDENLIDQIIKKDDILDNLQGKIISYLTRISSETLTHEQAHQEIVLVSVVNELENIGDIIVNNLMHIARKKIKSGMQFSKEGVSELKAMYKYVLNSMDMILDAIATGNQKLAGEIIKRKSEIIQMDNNFRISHFKRLQEGLHESIETSSVHLDYLGNIARINNIIVNMSYILINKK
ncbi:Na/Pi cotransporter family protein [Candidatus Desantisbacteria bacterium]|nr:Na/Pi cotransporter family protein [Candidatus Desantisbacteria bacterium]